MAGNNENFTVRVSADLRTAFKAACDRQDVTASQLFRRWMRDFVESDAQETLALAPAEKRQKKASK